MDNRGESDVCDVIIGGKVWICASGYVFSGWPSVKDKCFSEKQSNNKLDRVVDENKMPWKLPPPSLVLECIENWRNLDLRKKDDSEIDKELSSFWDSLKIFDISRVEKQWPKLWRVRKFNKLIRNVSECWEPPPVKCIIGRCNTKGSPVLYVSEKLRTPFEELLIQPNAEVYLIKYEPIMRLKLTQIVSKGIEATDINGVPFYDDESMLSYGILREFVKSEFLKPVGKGTEYLHRISASMCRLWFDKDGSDGWLYPSVQSSADVNIAIKPASAHRKLKIKDIRIVHLIRKESAIKPVRINDSSTPRFNELKMIIKSSFKGSVNEGLITWTPSDELGGYF